MMESARADDPALGRGGVDGRRHARLWRLITARTSAAGEVGAGHGWAEVVCTVAVERLGIDAAAITVRADGRTQQLVAASDDWAAAIEELQYTVGEGPGVAAFRAGEPVLVSRLAENDERWPGFGDEAAAAGVGAVFAFPLQAGAIRLGTIDLYRRRGGPLEADALGDAAVLADLAMVAVLSVDIEESDTALAGSDLRGFYDEVNVTTGMVATQLRISLEDALLRLRAYAFSHHLPLTEVSRAVVDRRLRMDTASE